MTPVPKPNLMHHSPINQQSHPDHSKMFLYKREHQSTFGHPISSKSGDTFHGREVQNDFRPSRSRPSFSDNTSLELLYSFFSTPIEKKS